MSSFLQHHVYKIYIQSGTKPEEMYTLYYYRAITDHTFIPPKLGVFEKDNRTFPGSKCPEGK